MWKNGSSLEQNLWTMPRGASQKVLETLVLVAKDGVLNLYLK